MFKLVVLVSFIACASARPQRQRPQSDVTVRPNYSPNPIELEQNKAAKYEFSSDIDDHIQDQTQKRVEVRDGLKVEGSYSYSDGNIKRTVFYAADENGFRIVKEETQPLEGAKVNLSGTASVRNMAHGRHIAYKVQSVPVTGHIPKIIE